MHPQTAWSFQALGFPRLCAPHRAPFYLDRKAAALLLYLGLEGPTARGRLAHLLWPDRTEKVARNNLVHLMRRLHANCGRELVEGAEVLSLSADFEVDLVQVREQYLQGRHQELLRYPEVLLEDCSYDDCIDFDDWLLAERERWRDWLQQALHTECARLEVAGEFDAALEAVRRLISLEPVSEEAYVRMMRLYYLIGDRNAALKAYQKCCAVLREELGAEPLPQTVTLMQEIQRGTRPAVPALRSRPLLPLAVLRPPRLVGREREWEQLERAWKAGQCVMILGEPGVGKSRLAQDFAAAHGPGVFWSARPGDRTAPYASLTRLYAHLLETFPGLELPGWVREEIARLLPELGDRPPPITSEDEKRRFFEAGAVLHRLVAARQPLTLCWDDLQFMDAASLEACAYLCTALATDLRLLMTCRSEDVNEALEQMIDSLSGAGQLVRVDLQPLPEAVTTELLATLELSPSLRLPFDLQRRTGGNPMFVLETVRNALEHGDAAGSAAIPARVQQVIRGRLQRLPAHALNAARAAAVLERDFDLEMVAGVLKTSELVLFEAWEELERSQIVRGNVFVHDLICEVILAELPASLRQVLYRNAARVLEQHGAEPARLAALWNDGGKPDHAARLLLEAAQRAEAAFRLQEAAEFYARAARLYASMDPDAAYRAWERCVTLLGRLGDVDAHQIALNALFEAARTPLQEALAWQRQSELYLHVGDGVRAERAACNGARLAHGDPIVEANLRADLGMALWLQDRNAEAAEALEAALAQLDALGAEEELPANYSNLGIILDHLCRYDEAARYHRRALELFEGMSDHSGILVTARNLAISRFEVGQMSEALEAIARALELEREGEVLLHPGYSKVVRGRILTALARYDAAQRDFEVALRLAEESSQARYRELYRVYHAELLLAQEDFSAAAEAFGRSLAFPGLPLGFRLRARVGRARSLLGREPDQARADLEAAMAESSAYSPIQQVALLLARARLEEPAAALDLSGQAWDLARAHGLEAHVRTARALHACALHRLGRADQARALAGAVLAELEAEVVLEATVPELRSLLQPLLP
ncbi:DNA-binding SARP family transcriptional activator [Deinobacterium chartae]|uniref:DNA-binding SARP family transcriptional activator n=1 Tax=Deinobacterium chartae TaxID=521158 RepID=A0A841HXK2_9DEIO|nr:AAA family ATPase [Deinobacterium chartae]MBB6096930.1 DNA-binding SARP family transcriptional activator [Deinobacterium chartae]